MKLSKWIGWLLCGLLLLPVLVVEAQKKKDRQRERSLRRETQDRFLKKWLKQDASYIITPEERDAFKSLNSDDERYQFIEQFWLRRDPNPDTVVNEFRDEHYRRIAYANERFPSGKQGWRTDRGRIYIMYGPPDQIETFHGGGTYYRPYWEGGGATSTHPYIKWRYRYLDGMDLGQQVIIEFVDRTLTGEYRIAFDPYEKDALKNTPVADLTEDQRMGVGDSSTRATRFPSGMDYEEFSIRQFNAIRQVAALNRAPKIRFKDLETVVDTKLTYNTFPFDYRTDFIKITEDTILTPITVVMKNSDMTFQDVDGVKKAEVNVFGRITTITGRSVQVFEEVVRQIAPDSLFKSALEKSSLYQTRIPLRSGLYKLELVLKDLNSGNLGTVYHSIRVPRFPQDQLATSSIILAEQLERLPQKQVAIGQFVIGSSKVLPSVEEIFDKDQPMGVYFQVYNLATDEQTQKPSATIEYVLKQGGREIGRALESNDKLTGASQQMTLQKLVALEDLEPGQYSLVVQVTDNVANRSIAPEARFVVR